MDAPEQIGRWAGPFAMFAGAVGAFLAFVKLLVNAGAWMQSLREAKEHVMGEIAELKVAVRADTERAERNDRERRKSIDDNANTLHEISERVGRIEGHLGLE